MELDMSLEMPVGMSYDGSQNVDSVTFVYADHTAASPHFVIVDRKAPVTRNGSTAFAQLRTRVFRDAVHPETGEKKKSVTEVTTRYPDFASIEDVQEDLASVCTLAASVDYQSAVENLMLPRTAAAA
jgi:hypothetical protein